MWTDPVTGVGVVTMSEILSLLRRNIDILTTNGISHWEFCVTSLWNSWDLGRQPMLIVLFKEAFGDVKITRFKRFSAFHYNRYITYLERTLNFFSRPSYGVEFIIKIYEPNCFEIVTEQNRICVMFKIFRQGICFQFYSLFANMNKDGSEYALLSTSSRTYLSTPLQPTYELAEPEVECCLRYEPLILHRTAIEYSTSSGSLGLFSPSSYPDQTEKKKISKEKSFAENLDVTKWLWRV